MALTVAAVIHFARHDTSAMELRLMEAKARTGAGVTLLALRDRAMATCAGEWQFGCTESGREGGSQMSTVDSSQRNTHPQRAGL